MSEQSSHDSLPTPPAPVDWRALRASAEYQDLRRSQRRFLIPASVIYLAVYFGFLLLSLSAPSLFRQQLHGGLNVGFVLMSAMFVLVWLGVLVHNRIARRSWDPRIERVRARAGQPREGDGPGAPAAATRQVSP